MATQMQLEVILARNRIATGVLWSRIPVLIYTEILSRENWEQVQSRFGGEATRAGLLIHETMQHERPKRPQLSYERISKIRVNLSRVHFCKR